MVFFDIALRTDAQRSQDLSQCNITFYTRKLHFLQCVLTTNVFSLFCRSLEKKQDVLLTHGDCVSKVADGFKAVGQTGTNIVAIANEKDQIYGLQFHPEV